MKLAVIGTVGLPACYGGFETLVENLVRQNSHNALPSTIDVYCSKAAYSEHPSTYLGSNLWYVPLKANGAQSVIYDIVCIIQAVVRKADVILLLGISGAIALPFVRMFADVKITTNIDGIEWRREKWGPLARVFLRWSERLAVRFSHEVIADNEAIAEYVAATYGTCPNLIAYGGDHAIIASDVSTTDVMGLPQVFALGLCRIEPENNIELILSSFAESGYPVVFVGNWDSSEYGRELRRRFAMCLNISILDPIYDPNRLAFLRRRASVYIHGHSAGGTNPSLVEMMHMGVPIIAFDCAFNRYTTENKAFYFMSALDIKRWVELCLFDPNHAMCRGNQESMLEIAKRKYSWSKICDQYFQLLNHQYRDPCSIGTT
jgi:glycosyltransferase involved in cell wall biosynthesis